MTRLGFIGASQKLSVSASPDSFTVQGPSESRHARILQADVVTYVTREGTASDSNGLRLAPDMPVILNFFGGESVSFVGESAGNLWVVETDG